MAQSNQPFKRPNLSESEEYQKIPPPTGQESTFVPPARNNPNIPHPNAPAQPFVNQPPPPTQEEINWAIQLEENVQKKGYKPTDNEMSVYQDIANRIVLFQQAQAQAQKYSPVPVPSQKVTVIHKRSKVGFFIK